MALYKYAKGVRIADLHARRIRFTQLSHLNDFWEGKALVRAVLDRDEMRAALAVVCCGTPAERAAKLGEYFRTLGESPEGAAERVALFDSCLKLSPSAVERVLGKDFESDWLASTDAQEARLIPGMVEGILASVGVLCLTDKPAHNLMWSHYGDQGRGIVFEFDSTDPFFGFGLNSGSTLYGLRQVDYRRSRPELPHLEDEQQTWKRLLFTKPEVWQYEQEWRLPRFLVDGVPSESNPDIVLFDLPPTAVSGVILGPKMDKTECDAITDDIASDPSLRHIRISRAFLSEDNYDLEIIPVIE